VGGVGAEVVVPPGRTIPPKLAAIADRIVPMGVDEAETHAAIKRFMTELDRNPTRDLPINAACIDLVFCRLPRRLLAIGRLHPTSGS